MSACHARSSPGSICNRGTLGCPIKHPEDPSVRAWMGYRPDPRAPRRATLHRDGNSWRLQIIAGNRTLTPGGRWPLQWARAIALWARDRLAG